MALTRLNNQALANITSAGLPSGTVLQTQYLQYTGQTDTTVANDTNVSLTHLAVNITPKATNSIIRIDAMVNGEWSNQVVSTNSVWFFYRDSTKLSAGGGASRVMGILMGTSITHDAANQSSTPEHTGTYSYFDTPSTTSQITYTVAVRQGNGSSATWYTNRTVDDGNSYAYERGLSFISATEIAG